MINVLYIEDDSSHVELTIRSLEASEIKFDLHNASTIAEAFLLLVTNEYDVILSDYRLPDGYGLDVISKALEINISAAIVLITNQEDINVAIAALKAGAVDYVVKQSDYLHRLPIVLNNAYKHSQLEKQKKALYEAENKYRNIFENAVEGIFQSSLDGRFLNVNPAMACIYGYISPEDMINSITSINKQIHISDENRNRFIEELNIQGYIENYEAQNLRKDGSIIWTSTNARAVKDELGRTIYIEGFLKDITERKQAELARIESENKYKNLVERFPGVVFLDDFYNEEISRYISPRIEDLLGYTPEEWINGNKIWEKGLHPDDSERVLAEDRRTNETGEPFRIEYRLCRKDGRYVWVREDAYLIRDQTGTPLFWQGILLDISVQKEAQEAIKASEVSYRGLFNSVSQAIYIQNREGFFLDVNDGASLMYGYPREYFIGKSPEVLSAPHKNNSINLARKLDLAFLGDPQEFEFWGLRKNGEIFPKTVTLTKGTYFGQDVVIAIAQDITGRKEAEKILERQLNALTVLHAASVAATQSNTEDEIIKQVIQITARVYPEVCGVLLLNEQGDVLTPHPSCIGPNIDNWQIGYPITQGISGRAVMLGKSIRVDDVSKDLSYIEITSEMKSELCVPFWVQNRIIGVFDVESKNAKAFDEEDERLLNTIASGLGTAIEKLRLFEAEQAQRQREAAMLDLIRAAASTLDLNQVLHIILTQLIKVISADSGSIQLLDGDRLNILAAIGNEAIIFSTNGPLIINKYPLNQLVITQNKTIRVDNCDLDERYIKSKDVVSIKSFLGIPLISKGKTIGMITLDSYEIENFSEQDETLGFALANQAATAIENARLFDAEQNRRKQAEVLRIATEELTTTIELEKLYGIIFNSLANLVAYDSASIETFKQGYYQIVAGRNISANLIGEIYTIDPEKWGGTAKLHQPILISDVQADNRFEKFPGSEYIHSWMGIPLFSQGKLLGYLNLDSKTPGFFSQEQVALVQTFANQAGIAIENARLFQEESRRSEIIEALANIANEIATTREILPALDKISERTLSLLNASSVAIYLLQEDKQTIKIVSARGEYQDELSSHTIKLGEGITGNIIANGKPEIVNEIEKDSRKVTIPGTPEEESDTMMSAPLILHGESIGAINAWRLKTIGLFDKSELNFLVSIAHQASISIESVRLFQETTRRAQESAAIAEVGRDISATLQLDIVLERIATYAKDLLESEASAIYLPETGTSFLRAISAIGLDSDEIKGDPLEMGVGILGNIAIQKFGEIVNDTVNDPRTVIIKGTEFDPYEHIMGVPVISKDELAGLLVVWRSGMENEFQKTELQFLSNLAQQAAVAIENAHLFELEQRRRREAEILSEATSALANTFNAFDLFENILNWLSKIAQYDSASIMLNEGDFIRLVAKRSLPVHFNIGQNFPMTNKWKEVAAGRKPFILSDAQNDTLFEKWNGSEYIRGWMSVAMFTQDKLIGFINLDSRIVDAYSNEQATLVQTFANQAATAIENAHLFEEERQRRREAENLRLAATAITSSLDSKVVLETILIALRQVVPFDSGTIMLLEDEVVKIVAAQGFENKAVLLNQTFPSANKLISILSQAKKPYILNDVVGDERFENWASKALIRGWMGIPLIAHDKVLGFITLDSLTVGSFDQNAATLAHTFALHATAAIENTQLFENLQLSNQELSLAYDTTLAGWAKALELRDKETHGHTNRVTDLTMELARFIGLSKADLVHLRRGVLLHDIGKMGVPDEILHKEGPLTKEEWIEMHKHPQYAFDLLYPILFLRPSLDVPYSHHEWWDGTGYPQKLKGEEIPLPARLFAIVDVWDALLSDRPYRKAWTKTKVSRYLQKQAGSHFDPNLVKVFLKMMDEKAKVNKQKTQPAESSKTIKGKK